MADLLAIIDNLVALLPQFELLLAGLFWFIGIIFVARSLLAAARKVEAPNSVPGWTGPLSLFAIGVAFIAFPSTAGSLMTSLFGSGEAASPDAIFEYAPSMTAPMADGNGAKILTGIVTVVQFVGIIGMARGLYLLNASANGTGQARTFGPGLTFLIASTIAMNFPVFVGMVEQLLTVQTGG